ncbi:MAG: 2-oxoglutarate/2-oxoacid ferredoxin oxidoreductase subunit alpha, partial [Pseudonocardiales bacterium]|nr:2-oxoglutarate/2-oxoacid ferredoxin oxidoreductase subunit alpha [Pseudonocardiales bacterium]
VLIPELNSGQLARVLRAEYLVDIRSLTKISGQPILAAEMEQAILQEIHHA